MSGYHENRAVLRDAEAGCEIEVRGGLEADDGDAAYDVTIRALATIGDEHDARTMRVSQTQWRAFVRAVGRLR